MILKDVVGIQTRAGICKILRRMEKNNLVKRHQINKVTCLWGITANGIHEANTEEKITDWTYFEPSKVNPHTLEHQLYVQRVHVICANNNVAFKPGRAFGSRADNDKIPDGVISINNRHIAVEIERFIKTKVRYKEIIYNYLKAVKAGKYYRILYVTPDPKKRDQLRKVFYSIEKIIMKIDGRPKPLKLSYEKHLKFFEFVWLLEILDYFKKHQTQ